MSDFSIASIIHKVINKSTLSLANNRGKFFLCFQNSVTYNLCMNEEPNLGEANSQETISMNERPSDQKPENAPMGEKYDKLERVGNWLPGSTMEDARRIARELLDKRMQKHVDQAPANSSEATEPKEEEITLPDPILQKEEKQEEAATEENIPEWQKGEEWEAFVNSRKKAAKEEVMAKKAEMNLNENFAAKKEYKEQRENIIQKIKEKLRSDMGEGPLTKEQEAELTSKINDTVFDNLIAKENKEYLGALSENKEKTFVDKTKEAASKVLNSKFVQWYGKQNKWLRLGATTALFTLGGYAIGTAAVGGSLLSVGAYGVGRLSRGGASILAGGAARVYAEKKWSIEDIEKDFEKRKEEIKNSGKSASEQSEEYAKLVEETEHKKHSANIKKSLVAVGIGAGAGLLAGLTEGAVSGKGLGHTLESKGGKASSITENRLHRGTLGEQQPVAPKPPVVAHEEVSTPTPKASESLSEAVKTEKPEMPVAPQAPSVPEHYVFKPEDLKHVPVKGNSNWGLLKETLEHDERFANLPNSGQKSFVLSTLNNKVLENPTEYAQGVGSDGSVLIGKEVDYSKLFENKKWIDSVLQKAKDLPENRIKLIESHDAKIAEWVKGHQGQKLDSKTVDEILNSDKKIKFLEHTPKGKRIYYEGETQEEMDLKGPNDVIETPETPEESVVPIGGSKVDLASTGNGLAGTAIAGAAFGKVLNISEKAKSEGEVKNSEGQKEKLEKEIEEAKIKMKDLENAKEQPDIPGVRSLQGDTKKAVAEMLSREKEEEYFRNDIDNIYGKKSLFGKIKSGSGLENKEWKEIASLNAGKVIDFFDGKTENRKPEEWGIPEKVITNLKVSEKHRALRDHINQLKSIAKEATRNEIDKNGTDVIPYESETVEKYLKRLGRFVAEHPKQKTVEISGGSVMETAQLKQAA